MCGVLIGWGVLVLVSDWVILVVAVMMVVMMLVNVIVLDSLF